MIQTKIILTPAPFYQFSPNPPMKQKLRKTLAYRRYKLSEALISNIRHGFPSKWMKCIGVTWTDGKTTTNELIYHIMKKAGKKIWIMSTISIDIGQGKWWNLSKDKLTSLTHNDFNRFMQQAKQNGLEYMIVEPSSHAINQYRFWPAKFIAVGITNLTHEHLDFHGTMEHYFRTKAEIFYKKLRPKSIGFMPYDFKFKKKLENKATVKKLYTFSKDYETDIFAKNIQEHPQVEADIYFHFETEKEKIHIKSQLIGSFNLDNILIAAWICKKLWLTNDQITKGIQTFSPPPGRVQAIKTEDNITIVIDFALTPNALTKLYESFQKLNYKKQTAIFGATWNRDKTKRPTMGKIATRFNDFVILTEDENYNEDGQQIISEIENGIDTVHYNNYKVIQDRKNAIDYAIKNAESWDVILLTGMWNFETRKMWKKQISRSDKTVILEILKKYGKKCKA